MKTSFIGTARRATAWRYLCLSEGLTIIAKEQQMWRISSESDHAVRHEENCNLVHLCRFLCHVLKKILIIKKIWCRKLIWVETPESRQLIAPSLCLAETFKKVDSNYCVLNLFLSGPANSHTFRRKTRSHFHGAEQVHVSWYNSSELLLFSVCFFLPGRLGLSKRISFDVHAVDLFFFSPKSQTMFSDQLPPESSRRRELLTEMEETRMPSSSPHSRFADRRFSPPGSAPSSPPSVSNDDSTVIVFRCINSLLGCVFEDIQLTAQSLLPATQHDAAFVGSEWKTGGG